MGLFNQNSGADLEIIVAIAAQEAIKEFERLKEQVEKVKPATEESGRAIDGFAAKLGVVAGSIIGATLSWKGLTASLENALVVERLTTGFEALQNKVGSDATNSLNALRDATKGLISDTELMSSANQAVLLGVDDGTGKFAEMANAALKLGNAMGIDAKNALDSLVTGIGRGEKEILDNLGVVINAEDAYRKYAIQIGTTADKLTELGRKEAIKAIASQAVIDSAKGLTDVNNTASEAYQRFTVSLSNAYDQISLNISQSDTLKNVFNGLAEVAQTLPGIINNLIVAFEGLSGWISKGADEFANITTSVLNFGTEIVLAVKKISQFASEINGNLLIAMAKLDVALFESSIGQFIWGIDGAAAAAARAKGRINELRTEILTSRGEVLKFDNSVSKLGNGFDFAIKNTNSLTSSVENLGGEFLTSSNSLKFNIDSTIKADRAFSGLKESTNKVVTSTEGFIKTTDKANKKLYEMIDIGKELSENVLEKSLKDQVKAIGDTFAQGNVQIEETIRVLEDLRRAYVSAGLDVKDVDSAIKGINLFNTEKIKEDVKKTNGLLSGIFEGINFTSLMGEQTEQFAANLGLQIENSLASSITDAFNSGDVGKAIKGLAGSLGEAVGSSFAGPIGGAIGRIVVDSVTNAVDSISKGEKVSDRDIIGNPLGAPFLLGYNAIFGGGMSAADKARKEVELYLEEILGNNVLFGEFTGKFEQTFADTNQAAKDAFDGIGQYLLDLLGITEDVSGDIAASLGGTFGTTIDDLKYVVDDLGITFEQVQDQMVNAFLAGDKSAQEVIVTLSSIEEAFKPGLEGAGQFTKAMDNLIGSMGMGRESLKSLKDLAVEFKETGGNSLAAFRAALESSGKYTAEQIQTLFQALSQRGINSLDDLANASDLTLIGIIADLQTLGFQFSEGLGTGIKDSIKDINELRDTITKLPDTVEKNLRINVSTNYKDSQSQQALNQLTAGSPGIPRV